MERKRQQDPKAPLPVLNDKQKREAYLAYAIALSGEVDEVRLYRKGEGVEAKRIPRIEDV